MSQKTRSLHEKRQHFTQASLFIFGQQTNVVALVIEKKLLKFEAEGRAFAKFFEITRTIYSNSERSEQFLMTECFF